MMLSDVCLSDVCLSRTSGLSREQRGLAGKTKIGTEVAHVIYVTPRPLSRSKGQRSRSPGRFSHRRVNASDSCSGERGNVLAVGNYCYVRKLRSARRREALRRPRREEGLGHIVADDRLQIVLFCF